MKNEPVRSIRFLGHGLVSVLDFSPRAGGYQPSQLGVDTALRAYACAYAQRRRRLTTARVKPSSIR